MKTLCCSRYLLAVLIPSVLTLPGAFGTSQVANRNAEVECVTHRGGEAEQDAKATAVVLRDDGSISCPLIGGETTFVLALPSGAALDHLTFVNGNAAARGELRIAVANANLPVDSANWVAVDGSVPFEHKRRFDVSLIGVDAKFVRVTFAVAQESKATLAADQRDGANYAAITAAVPPMLPQP
ncbi:MAG: hypothetical protein JO354_01910 [Verrucomicrobia bacterium]|nr:hypothetical protein [Verrucomicrobiota bacterium]